MLIERYRKRCTHLSAMDEYTLFAFILIGFTISSVSITDYDSLIYIKSKETICTSSDDYYRESCFLRKSEYFWKKKDIIITCNIEIILCYCLGLKRWKERYIKILLEKVRSFHMAMIFGSVRKSNRVSYSLSFFLVCITGSYPPFDQGLQRSTLQTHFPNQMMTHFFSRDSII